MTADNRANKRILVLRLGAIGDCLRVLPAVARLRREFPESTIAWAVEHWVVPVLKDNPLIDEFHVLDRDRMKAGPRAAVAETRRLAAEIRARDYDVLLDFHGRLKSGVIARLSRVPRRIGYARVDGSECNHLFMTEHVRLEDTWENRVQRFLHLLAPLGVDTRYAAEESGLYLEHQARQQAEDWLAQQPTVPLAVYPGCSKPRIKERWPADKWVELLRRLTAQGVAASVFWGPAEHEFAADIANRVGAGCALAPATTLPQMMAMLGRCRAYVGSDTAAMHMAWMQGVPAAVFMGPKPLRTASPMPPVPHRLLRADEHYVEGLPPGRQSDRLVQAVSVDAAHEAVAALLAEPCKTSSNNIDRGQS